MKQGIKKATSILIAIITVILIISAGLLGGFGSVVVQAAEIVDSGTCGENLTWTFDSEGVLTIRGSGDMYNYPEWDDWGQDVYYLAKKIRVEEGVSSIGDAVFNAFSSVSEVSLPSSLRTIGIESFWLCSGITEMEIPDGVVSIGDAAFSACQGLKKITIPKSVRTIGEDAFKSCDNLTIYGYSGSAAEKYANDNYLSFSETHVLTKHKAVSASCVKKGNREYYSCSGCGKFFGDKDGKNEIEEDSWVIPATGHSYETTLKKATLKADGSITKVCGKCKAEGKTTVIKKIKTVTLSKKVFDYNGKVQKPAVTVKDSAGKTIAAKNYTVTYSNENSKNVGTYIVKVKFKGNYSGSKSVEYQINRASNTITKITPASKTLEADKLKKKSQSFNLKATCKFKANTAFAMDSKTAASSKRYINVTKAGKVTVKKGTPKGTYKIKVRVTAAKMKNYKATTTTKAVKIVVR